jgi:hypothetical protein
MKRALFSIVIVSLSLLLNNAIAQNVNIPDVSFKAILIADDNIDTNFDDEIQESEANNYGGIINVSNAGIADLTGIEAFTSISELICYSNFLVSLDLSANISLVSVIGSKNVLKMVVR